MGELARVLLLGEFRGNGDAHGISSQSVRVSGDAAAGGLFSVNSVGDLYEMSPWKR
jgi:hypothetical protein